MKTHHLDCIILICILLPCIMIVSAAAQQQPERPIMVKGANAMATHVEAWGAAYTKTNPAVRIIVSGGGTDLGFESFFDKKADLVMATRKILDKELQLAALTGIKPTELEIGKLAIAIITHPENPVSVLTMEQLRKILTGEYTKWTDVGGPNDPIIVITSEQVTGTALFLRKTVMENGIFGSDALARTYFHDIIIEVSRKKPFAISYAGLIDAERGVANKAIKIISLRKDDLSPPVSPSAETLRDGSYPLILPIYFYWNREAPGTHVTAFVDFCKAASQAGR